MKNVENDCGYGRLADNIEIEAKIWSEVVREMKDHRSGRVYQNKQLSRQKKVIRNGIPWAN